MEKITEVNKRENIINNRVSTDTELFNYRSSFSGNYKNPITKKMENLKLKMAVYEPENFKLGSKKTTNCMASWTRRRWNRSWYWYFRYRNFGTLKSEIVKYLLQEELIQKVHLFWRAVANLPMDARRGNPMENGSGNFSRYTQIDGYNQGI